MARGRHLYGEIQMTDIAKAAVVRLAKSAGIERISNEAAIALCDSAEKYVQELTLKSAKFMIANGRSTLKARDIALALEA